MKMNIYRIQAFGTDLFPTEQREMVAKHKPYTREHNPWPELNIDSGPWWIDDQDWLAHTVFPVCETGRLDRRSHGDCISFETYPDNPEEHAQAMARFHVNCGPDFEAPKR